MEHKILYREEKPIKRELIFNNREEFYKFWNPYFTEILNLCWDKKINWHGYYIYKTLRLNKDGAISKPHNHKELTEKQKAKQRKGFNKYVEKRRKETLLRQKNKKIVELESKIKLLKLELQNLKNSN